MFYLDKLVLKLIADECTRLGGSLMLGPAGGAMIYIVSIGWSIYTGIKMSKRDGADKK